MPRQFPFALFSDNGQNIFLYQIQVFTLQARSDFSQVDTTGYFAFNALDREMKYFKVDGLNKLIGDEQKFIEVMSRKLLLRSGFIFNTNVYLITDDSVYVVDKKEMQSNPIPKRIKIPLVDFLQCDPKAIGKV